MTTTETPAATLIAELRAAGHTAKQIAASAGVHVSTVYRWAKNLFRPIATRAAALAALAAAITRKEAHMGEEPTHKAGDEIIVGDDTIVIGSRKGSSGVRWTWDCPRIGVGSEGTYATPEDAITNARRTLGSGECRHGIPTAQFCPTCHDREI